MPNKIDDLKRTSYDIGNQAGASTISMFSMFSNADVDTESESGYKRTTSFNKQKVLVKYQSARNYKKSEIIPILFQNELNKFEMQENVKR